MATWEQHKWYRGVVLPTLREYTGYASLGELHAWLKRDHMPLELFDEDGDPPSCASITVEQFSSFLGGVLDWAGEQGIYIPPARGSE